MGRTVFTSKGTPVEIGRELGKGGEGSVFEVAALKDQVAKLYHKTPDSKKQAKLSYMASTADAQLLSYVAWPQDTLHHSKGGPVTGFLMPRVAGKDSIHMIYSPAHRRQDYPKAAWDFLLYVSRNIAASFEAVHSHGHVIGDVNQNSFMVGRDSKVVLIDSDSFQVNARGTLHLCAVGVSHFTPPELQSLSSFDGFTRTANHDRFGLALLIFHVLFGGRHPYSGVPQRSGVGEALESDIKNFRYAYARDNQSRGFKPPPRSIPISMLPDSIESMFHAAFTETGAAGNRPSAQQWVTALDALRGRLKRCGASPMHLYPDRLTRCPWCALEQEGVIYFLDLGATVSPSATGFVFTQVWAVIQVVPAPQPLSIPSPNTFTVTAQPLPAGMTAEGMVFPYRVLAIGGAVGIFFFAPSAWILALLVAWAGWAAAGNFGSSVRSAETAKRTAALRSAKDEYDELVERAQKEAGREGFQSRKAVLENLRAELEALDQAEKRELDALHSTAQERQRLKFLDTCFIDSASIPGVGPTRKAALRSFGIETAADVTMHRVVQVRGFGEGLTRAVLDWKASCERRFIFNPASAVSSADRATVKAKFAARKAAIERLLAAAPAQLKQFTQEATSRLASIRPKLEDAAAKLAQAQADHAALSGKSIASWSSLSSAAKFAIIGLAMFVLLLAVTAKKNQSSGQPAASIPVPIVASMAPKPSEPSGVQSGPAPVKKAVVTQGSRTAGRAPQRQAEAAVAQTARPTSTVSTAAAASAAAASSAREGRETDGAATTNAAPASAPAPALAPAPAPADSVDASDQAAIERACSGIKRFQGLAQYEGCVRAKTAELRRNPPASIDGVAAAEVASLARSCSGDLRFNGPGAYNACMARGLAELRRHPEVDLSALSTSDRASIERACRVDKQYNGPGRYNACLSAKASQLARSPSVDLSDLSASDRASMENSCRIDWQYNGPGAYNTCLTKKRAELQRNPPEDLNALSATQRSAVEAACRMEIQYNGPGAYNACVSKMLRGLPR